MCVCVKIAKKTTFIFPFDQFVQWFTGIKYYKLLSIEECLFILFLVEMWKNVIDNMTSVLLLFSNFI